MRLILARHGQSLANVDPITYGGKDAALTSLGERQAEHLGQWLKRHMPDVDKIMCSALRRAIQTAQIANQQLRLPLEVNPDLNEIGRYDYPILRRRAHPLKPDTVHRADDDDGYYDQYCQQVDRALRALTADLERPEPLLVISHGGTMATLLRLILERHDISFLNHNTAMNFLEWADGRWKITGLNQTPHLPHDMIS